MKPMIYLDHSATSWPKPQAVLDAMMAAMTSYGANPGRGAYAMALQAAREVYLAREVITTFFHGDHPQRLIFTNNTTQGVNFALKGLLQPGDHLLYSPLEHNAVWRPVTALQEQGVETEMVPADEQGIIDLAALAARIKPNTKMIACVHASNITGAIQPVAEIGALARAHDLLFLVDAAQSAGILPIDVQAMQIDLLAAPGHKGLYGPMGTGILWVGPRAEHIRPILQGGTGSKSLEPHQPEAFPDRLECGTLNLAGIAGLRAGVEWLQQQGMEQIHHQLMENTQYLLQGLAEIPGLIVYGPPVGVPRTTLVSVNLAGMSSNELAFALDQEYGIAVRAGFHCSPLGHRQMGTLAEGAVRFSLGTATTRADLDAAIQAMQALAKE